jgi:type I restriction enzyme S subunit
MSEWKEYSFGEIAEVVMGQSPKGETCNGIGIGYPLLNGPTEFTSFHPIPTQYTTDPKRFSEVNDLLFCVRGSTTGKMNWSDQRYAIGRGIGAIRHRHGANLNHFIKAIVDYHLPVLLQSATGSTFPNVSREQLTGLKIIAPDLTTQKAIAEILSSLDDKIELNNQINQNLEALAQALFKQWFVDFEFPNENGEPYKSSGGEMIDSELGEIPKGWRVGMLEEVIEFSNGYSFKSSELLDEDLGNCFHVFKMGHIKKGGGLNAEGTKSYFEKGKTSKLGKYVLKIGDLLMCMTDMKGNVALLGHTALMNEDEKYIVNQRVGLLRPRNSVGIDYPYLYILTNSTLFIEDLRSRANSGVQVNLSTSEIRNTKIIIPDFQTNSAFDQAVKPFFLRLFNSQKENHSLRTLRDTLLPKLISGELEVNESLLEPTF